MLRDKWNTRRSTESMWRRGRKSTSNQWKWVRLVYQYIYFFYRRQTKHCFLLTRGGGAAEAVGWNYNTATHIEIQLRHLTERNIKQEHKQKENTKAGKSNQQMFLCARMHTHTHTHIWMRAAAKWSSKLPTLLWNCREKETISKYWAAHCVLWDTFFP